MTSGFHEPEGGAGLPAAHSDIPADDAAPTEALVFGTVGDRCVNCGAPLSSDQRYCVVCGERRGAPRFTLPTAAAAPEPAPISPQGQPRRPRVSSGATLVAGVGTLLLAMGVGVIIGHSSSGTTKTVASAPTQVITVGAGSGTSASTSGSGSASSGKSSAKTKSHSKSHGKAKPSTAASKAAAKQQASAAAKVLGGSAKNVPPPTVTVGQKGSGAGYNKKTHKFDGSFFGQ